MTYTVAIARFRAAPTILHDVPDVETARADADRYYRDDLRSALIDGHLPARFEHHPRGDYVVVPTSAITSHISSADLRAAAVYSTAGRDWRSAFSDDDFALARQAVS